MFVPWALVTEIPITRSYPGTVCWAKHVPN